MSFNKAPLDLARSFKRIYIKVSQIPLKHLIYCKLEFDRNDANPFKHISATQNPTNITSIHHSFTAANILTEDGGLFNLQPHNHRQSHLKDGFATKRKAFRSQHTLSEIE